MKSAPSSFIYPLEDHPKREDVPKNYSEEFEGVFDVDYNKVRDQWKEKGLIPKTMKIVDSGTFEFEITQTMSGACPGPVVVKLTEKEGDLQLGNYETIIVPVGFKEGNVNVPNKWYDHMSILVVNTKARIACIFDNRAGAKGYGFFLTYMHSRLIPHLKTKYGLIFSTFSHTFGKGQIKNPNGCALLATLVTEKLMRGEGNFGSVDKWSLAVLPAYTTLDNVMRKYYGKRVFYKLKK